jgi:hypothetical protein
MGKRAAIWIFVCALLAAGGKCVHAQAALMMEEPYGFIGAVNPTGHNALYFERVCAETPVKLRRCQAGEMGVVLSRYEGLAGYDWVAIPLIPYLYSVETAAQVPAHVDRPTVNRLRDRYHEAHLLSLGENLEPGDFFHGGWTELVGTSYERRIYAFRFATTPEQDDALIARLNAGVNRSNFRLLFNNCADFARAQLNAYFPGVFKRSIFPDAGMTTPKQIAYKLERYACRHPEMQLAIFEIPQIPGFRRTSRSNKSVAESLTTTAYAVPIVLANPYLAGGLVVDYLARGRHHILPKHPQLLTPQTLDKLNSSALTVLVAKGQNPASAGMQASGAVAAPADESETETQSGLQESKLSHE